MSDGALDVHPFGISVNVSVTGLANVTVVGLLVLFTKLSVKFCTNRPANQMFMRF